MLWLRDQHHLRHRRGLLQDYSGLLLGLVLHLLLLRLLLLLLLRLLLLFLRRLLLLFLWRLLLRLACLWLGGLLRLYRRCFGLRRRALPNLRALARVPIPSPLLPQTEQPPELAAPRCSARHTSCTAHSSRRDPAPLCPTPSPWSRKGSPRRPPSAVSSCLRGQSQATPHLASLEPQVPLLLSLPQREPWLDQPVQTSVQVQVAP